MRPGVVAASSTIRHKIPVDAGRAGIELGCGTAYVSAWLARRGVQVVGIDASPAQLATARRLQREHGLRFPLIEAVDQPGSNREAQTRRDAMIEFDRLRKAWLEAQTEEQPYDIAA